MAGHNVAFWKRASTAGLGPSRGEAGSSPEWRHCALCLCAGMVAQMAPPDPQQAHWGGWKGTVPRASWNPESTPRLVCAQKGQTGGPRVLRPWHRNMSPPPWERHGCLQGALPTPRRPNPKSPGRQALLPRPLRRGAVGPYQ